MLNPGLSGVSTGLFPRTSANSGHHHQTNENHCSSPRSPLSHGTVQRPTPAMDGKNLPNRGDLDPGKMSLMEKLQLHYHSKKVDRGVSSKYCFRFLFQFQVISQLYMTLNYIVPYVFSDLDPMSQYYLKVLASFVFVMGEANWLCAICYSSNLPDFRDRPSLDFNEWFENPPETFGVNGHIKANCPTEDRNGLEWSYCNECGRYRPPRAHHCELCKTCILRRDHHCYLIGACIGHYNQRYFIVFCLYGILAGSVGFCATVSCLAGMPDAVVWYDYVFPWAFFKMCLGQVTWQFALLTFQATNLFVFGCMSVIYGTGQLILVSVGMTMYEVAKQVDVKVTSTSNENMKLVFGDYWLLNLLFPAQILFKQRHDGIHYDNIKFGGSKNTNIKVSVE